MTETQLDLNQPVQPPVEPTNRTTGALVLFLLFAIPMPICMLMYHFVLWSTEQSAIADGSLANLAWAGPIGLFAQGLIMTGVITALWYFTKDDRFKPVYEGWLGAAIVAFPALILRFLGPNNDQLGSIAQIVICLIAFAVVVLIRKVKLDCRAGNVSIVLILPWFCVDTIADFRSVGPPNEPSPGSSVA